MLVSGSLQHLLPHQQLWFLPPSLGIAGAVESINMGEFWFNASVDG